MCLRATAPARTPDIEPLWPEASRISPQTTAAHAYCYISAFVCVGGWRAHPRGAAEHLLGSSPTNQTSDAR